MAVHAENFQVSPELLSPGTEVNGWRIRERLGTGGFGAAYQVESTARPGEFFALKMARHLSDERVEREIALLMTRAIHPHVVRLHAFGRWPHPATGYLYFVMDWVQGLPLHTWAETHNPTVRLAVEKLATVAMTLEHLHTDGVLHRDLKPEHMLIRDVDGKPVLIDFGVGWYAGADTLTTHGMAPGTPHLRSPEAVAFWRKHGGKLGVRYAFKPTDDVYALGVSAYRVLTGHWPFPPHLDREALFGAIEGLVPPAPSAVNHQLPVAVSDAVQRMMAKRPQDRFPSCAEAHAALVAALSFAGYEAVETELFAWEAVPEAQRAPHAPERRVRVPEWPTLPKSSSSAPPKLPAVSGLFRRARDKKAARADAPEPEAPEGVKLKRKRRIPIPRWALPAVMLMGIGALGWFNITTLLKIKPEPKLPASEGHPTLGVVKKSSALAGQKVALGPEWPDPFWVAVPLRDPTPAAVISVTKPEDVPAVKSQKLNHQMTGQRAPEIPSEKPAGKVLDGARKALAVAVTCTALAGCAAGLPALPSNRTEGCPYSAVQAMKALKMNNYLLRPFEYATQREPRIITVRESERIVWTMAGPGSSKLPQGTQFIGRLWVRDFAYARIDRIVTPDGTETPVCLELVRSVPIKTVVPWEPNMELGAKLDEPSTEPGIGRVQIKALYFETTRVWGDPNTAW